MKMISFKAEEDLVEKLDRYCYKYGLYRSEVIRIAIEKLIQEEAKEENIKARVIKVSLR